MDPHRGWTIASSSWNFVRKRWLDREQELITVIQEKTKRTEPRKRKKLGTAHQRGQYYKHCKRSTEIPKGGYVRILAESLLWEERLGKTRMRTTEGLTTCMEPHRGWTIASSSWNFVRKCWLDREQELITVIQEKTKRTEEKEEAGYRSPTWSILRALQKINNAKRLEGGAVMSAPPFFQSAGRGDLRFWGEDDGPTVVVWESLSESEQE